MPKQHELASFFEQRFGGSSGSGSVCSYLVGVLHGHGGAVREPAWCSWCRSLPIALLKGKCPGPGQHITCNPKHRQGGTRRVGYRNTGTHLCRSTVGGYPPLELIADAQAAVGLVVLIAEARQILGCVRTEWSAGGKYSSDPAVSFLVTQSDRPGRAGKMHRDRKICGQKYWIHLL